ncbi:DUF4184 family protein [Fusobacterium varium]|uniref:DUF4184 family protein n=1 Tax=Fusobacterium varium TaxID=856 RepID=UPI003562D184
MPFTFSHPAIILPLKKLPKKYISMTGLIVGSIAPDFEYFLRMKSKYSHTMSGILWYDLPMGIFLAFLFHNLIKEALINNMPLFFEARFINLRNFNWNSYFKKNWYIVIISIIIGICSHILWDGFTHRTGHFVKIFPVLESSVKLFGTKIPIYRGLQHISTLIGGIVVIKVVINLPPDPNCISQKGKYKYWFFLIVSTPIIMFYGLSKRIPYYSLWHVIVNFITAFLISLILTSFIFREKKKKIKG